MPDSTEHRYCRDCYAVERRFHRWPEKPAHAKRFDEPVRCCYCGTLTHDVAVVLVRSVGLLACRGHGFHHKQEEER